MIYRCLKKKKYKNFPQALNSSRNNNIGLSRGRSGRDQDWPYINEVILNHLNLFSLCLSLFFFLKSHWPHFSSTKSPPPVSLPCLSFTDDACPSSTFCPSSLFNSARFQLPVRSLVSLHLTTLPLDLTFFFFFLFRFLQTKPFVQTA